MGINRFMLPAQYMAEDTYISQHVDLPIDDIAKYRAYGDKKRATQDAQVGTFMESEASKNDQPYLYALNKRMQEDAEILSKKSVHADPRAFAKDQAAFNKKYATEYAKLSNAKKYKDDWLKEQAELGDQGFYYGGKNSGAGFMTKDVNGEWVENDLYDANVLNNKKLNYHTGYSDSMKEVRADMHEYGLQNIGNGYVGSDTWKGIARSKIINLANEDGWIENQIRLQPSLQQRFKMLTTGNSATARIYSPEEAKSIMKQEAINDNLDKVYNERTTQERVDIIGQEKRANAYGKNKKKESVDSPWLDITTGKGKGSANAEQLGKAIFGTEMPGEPGSYLFKPNKGDVLMITPVSNSSISEDGSVIVPKTNTDKAYDYYMSTNSNYEIWKNDPLKLSSGLDRGNGAFDLDAELESLNIENKQAYSEMLNTFGFVSIADGKLAGFDDKAISKANKEAEKRYKAYHNSKITEFKSLGGGDEVKGHKIYQAQQEMATMLPMMVSGGFSVSMKTKDNIETKRFWDKDQGKYVRKTYYSYTGKIPIEKAKSINTVPESEREYMTNEDELDNVFDKYVSLGLMTKEDGNYVFDGVTEYDDTDVNSQSQIKMNYDNAGLKGDQNIPNKTTTDNQHAARTNYENTIDSDATNLYSIVGNSNIDVKDREKAFLMRLNSFKTRAVNPLKISDSEMSRYISRYRSSTKGKLSSEVANIVQDIYKNTFNF